LNITYLQIDQQTILVNQNVNVYLKTRRKSQQSSKARKSVQGMQNDKACKTARKVTKAEIEVSRW